MAARREQEGREEGSLPRTPLPADPSYIRPRSANPVHLGPQQSQTAFVPLPRNHNCQSAQTIIPLSPLSPSSDSSICASAMKTLQPFKSLLRSVGRSVATMPVAVADPKVPEVEREDSPTETFYHKDLLIERCLPWQMADKPGSADQLKFGHTFADHMMEVDWSQDHGWSRPLICPIKDLQLHPGAKALHYAIQLFEGMKAYRGTDDRIRLFRPEMNMARMRRSAARSSLPDFDPEELIQIICEQVRVDKDWVPSSSTASLYIRPTLIATDPTLGVAHPRTAKLFVLSGPVGSYYQNMFKPVSLLADPNVVRAFPGGVGSFKMGCNYAPTIMIGKLAAEYGCQQVLWLSGKDQKLAEVGSMNIFIYWRDEKGELELITPPVSDGIILPGITRDTLLTIAREWGEFRVSERYPTMEELRQALVENRLLQMFGSGTACAVSPVGRIVFRDPNNEGRVEQLIIPTMSSGTNVMQRFYEIIVDIQYGRVDRPDWVRVVD